MPCHQCMAAQAPQADTVASCAAEVASERSRHDQRVPLHTNAAPWRQAARLRAVDHRCKQRTSPACVKHCRRLPPALFCPVSRPGRRHHAGLVIIVHGARYGMRPSPAALHGALARLCARQADRSPEDQPLPQIMQSATSPTGRADPRACCYLDRRRSRPHSAAMNPGAVCTALP